MVLVSASPLASRCMWSVPQAGGESNPVGADKKGHLTAVSDACSDIPDRLPGSSMWIRISDPCSALRFQIRMAGVG